MTVSPTAISGALFNAVNKRISLWRRHNLANNKHRQFGEALVVAFVSATCFYVLPLMFQARLPMAGTDTPPHSLLAASVLALTCPKHTNDSGTLPSHVGTRTGCIRKRIMKRPLTGRSSARMGSTTRWPPSA